MTILPLGINPSSKPVGLLMFLAAWDIRTCREPAFMSCFVRTEACRANARHPPCCLTEMRHLHH